MDVLCKEDSVVDGKSLYIVPKKFKFRAHIEALLKEADSVVIDCGDTVYKYSKV